VTFTFTGLGCIGPVLSILGGMFGGLFGYLYVSSTLAGAMFSAAVSVVLAALVASAIGRELNLDRTATAGGERVYHDRHTADGLPLQDWYVAGALYAMACVLVGLWGVVGVRGLIVGAGLLLLALFVVWRVRRWRKRPADPAARTVSRPKLAREHGWQLGRPAPELVDHWSRLPHEAGHLGLPDGLAGELDGLPITVFDTRPPRRSPDGVRRRKVARTVCVVGLPAGYPPVHVREVWRDDDGGVYHGMFLQPPFADLIGAGDALQARLDHPPVADLVVVGEPGAEWVATPEVLRVTAECALAGWRLDGHDLALVREGGFFRSNAEVMAALRGLVELARALPAPVSRG
jgi:hypothetical protein